MKSQIFFVLSGSALLSAVAIADPHVTGLFSNDMILQRNFPVPIWGTADPGEGITVSIAGQNQKTTAEADGKWTVRLAPLAAADSLDLTIAGKTTLAFKNVAVGEVWLASGQSNMSYQVSGASGAKEAIATSTDPGLRLFLVANGGAVEPQTTVGGHWLSARPGAVNGFPAVGYFFARALRENLKVPIGIIGSSVPGTAAQAWTSREALTAVPDLKTAYIDPWDKRIAADEAGQQKYRAEVLPAWQKQVDDAKAAGTEAPAKPEPPKPLWMGGGDPTHLFNGKIAPLIPYGIAGAVWYQGEGNANRSQEYQTLLPTMIKDWRKRWGMDFPFATVQLANLGEPQLSPAEGGWAEIRDAMRIITQTVPKTGIASAADLGLSYELHPPNKSDIGRRLALWAEATVYGENVEYSGPLFDSMKVEGDKIRVRFTHAKGMVAIDNSSRFGDEIIPRRFDFYEILDNLAQTGILADSPVPYDVKKEYSRRQYAQIIDFLDRKMAANNWTLDTVQLPEDAKRPRFKLLYERRRSLLAPQIQELKTPWHGELRGFGLSGADGKWVWAEATIEGDSVVVRSLDVTQPVAVCYNWSGNPIGNLYNGAGLPAPGFRVSSK